jgi:hypothetical protein
MVATGLGAGVLAHEAQQIAAQQNVGQEGDEITRAFGDHAQNIRVNRGFCKHQAR